MTVGITSYATDQLGDVVFVELPAVGRKLEAHKPFGVVEAVWCLVALRRWWYRRLDLEARPH